jgi:hypothetical protein
MIYSEPYVDVIFYSSNSDVRLKNTDYQFIKEEFLGVNTKQRASLLISIAFFILSELFPPWQYSYVQDNFIGTCPAGFSLRSQPPTVKTYGEMQRLCYTSDTLGNISTNIDINKLWLQRIIIILVFVSNFLNYDAQRSKNLMVLGRSIFAIGLVLLMLYILLLYFIYF